MLSVALLAVNFTATAPELSGRGIPIAQAITPSDGATTVTPSGNQIEITGGHVSGNGGSNNIFHNFLEFGLSADQTANFITTPNVDNVLSTVNGGHASMINGMLQVSGSDANLYLINPAGIIFGETATLNLGGDFTATTADRLGFGDNWLGILANETYTHFSGTPDRFGFTADQPGRILNLGQLAVASGQRLTLFGGEVINSGTLLAPDGEIALLSVTGDRQIRINPNGDLLGLEVTPLALTDNAQTLTPLSLPDLLTGGTISHNLALVTAPDGTVTIETVPLTSGSTVVSGQISTAGSQGGQIALLGDQVSLMGAAVNASGSFGGGTVRIGGGYQGQGNIPNALTTLVDNRSEVLANANQTGDGGTIITWGNTSTTINGILAARGGQQSGNGGLIETSAATLRVTQTPDASATQGRGGLWFIDPIDITIVPGENGVIGSSMVGVENINGALNNGTNVTITTGIGGAEAGNITQQVGATIEKVDGPNVTLRLEAANNISLNDNILLEDGTGGLTVELIADADDNGMGSIFSGLGTEIRTGGGDLLASGASLQLGEIVTTFPDIIDSGNVDLTSAGNITFETIDTRGVQVAAGDVSILAKGTVRGTETIDEEATIAATADTDILEDNGTVTIQHDGGPDNVPFEIGDASVNGTAGTIEANDAAILGEGSSPVLPNGGNDANIDPATGVTITSINTPPTLTAAAQLPDADINQSVSFTLADLNLTVVDTNNDTTTVQIASVANGTLLRNGVTLGPGDPVAPNETLQFVPTAGVRGVLTPVTLQASDGVSKSAPVAISLNIRESSGILPLDPTVNGLQPLSLHTITPTETIVTLGEPLVLSPLLNELVVLGAVLPEAPFQIVTTDVVPVGGFPGAGFNGFQAPDGPQPQYQISDPGIFPDPGFTLDNEGTVVMPSVEAPPASSDVSPIQDPVDVAPGGIPGGIPDSAPDGAPDGTPGGVPGDTGVTTGVDVPEAVAIAPETTQTTQTTQATQTSAMATGLRNCQAESRAIKATASRDRTETVYTSLISCHKQNLATATTQENSAWVTYALNNLGAAHFVIGDYLAALDFHEQQLATARKLNNKTQQGIAQGSIGAVYAALGDYDTAIGYYQRSLALLTLETAPQWKALTYRNLGNAYFAQKDYDRATEQQLQSLDISRAINDTYGEMQAHGNLGHTHSIQRDFAQAIAAYEQGLTLANQLSEDLEITQMLLGLSTTYGYQQDYEQAYSYAEQSWLLSRELGAKLGEGIALTNMGNALLSLNRLSEAEPVLFNAITIWEALRAGLGTHDEFKVSIFETQLAAYRNLEEVLVNQNKLEAALEISERGRARAFVELIARGQVNSNQSGPVTPPSIEQMKHIAKTQNSTLVEYSIIREQVADTPHGASVQTAIESEDVQLYIWVIQPTGQVHLRQVELKSQLKSQGTTLVKLVETSRDRSGIRGASAPDTSPDTTTRTFPTSAFTSTLQRRQHWQNLHQLLIDPITDLLPSDPNARVVFIPQEQLFLVPFPALQANDGSYLIEHHTILTAPAIQVLGLTDRDIAPPSGQPLIVGNPSPMPADNLQTLPHADTEASGIANVLSTQPLIGDAATETIIKQQLSTAPLIHLATHGFFNEAKPLQGALALAPTPDQDGFLTAEEILSQPLTADLVVLSACDTGRGKITGDGVIGLSRSFIAAGANNLVVSLWQVPDDATAELMIEFYRQRQTLDNAQALRQAMLATQQIYEDPIAWAAFTLIGAVE